MHFKFVSNFGYYLHPIKRPQLAVCNLFLHFKETITKAKSPLIVLGRLLSAGMHFNAQVQVFRQ
jgi:hypothetical protein